MGAGRLVFTREHLGFLPLEFLPLVFSDFVFAFGASWRGLPSPWPLLVFSPEPSSRLARHGRPRASPPPARARVVGLVGASFRGAAADPRGAVRLPPAGWVGCP